MDKLAKVRAEVEKLKSKLLRGARSSQVAMETRCKEEAYNEVLAILDTMQENPVCAFSTNRYTDEDRKVLCDSCEEECEFNKKEEPVSEDFEDALTREWKSYNDRGAATVDALEDNTQELTFAKGFYQGAKWGKHQAEVEIHAQSIALAHGCPKENTSDDLEEAAKEHAVERFRTTRDEFLAEKCKWSFKAGAQWQKEQFEKNRLKHCDSITNEQAELESDFIDQHLDKYQRMPTFLDAIEYGMNLQKEQMMSKAVDATITDIRTYKEKNEVDFTATLEKGIIPYEIEQKVKITSISMSTKR